LLMTPLPLSSTLFPYTTLFRSRRLLVSWDTRPWQFLFPTLRRWAGGRVGRWFRSACLRKFGGTISKNHFLRATLPFLNNTASRSDRKSTRLNSSHVAISYAVFC